MKIRNLLITTWAFSVAFTACMEKEQAFDPALSEEEVAVEPEDEVVAPEGEFSYLFKLGGDETKSTFDTDHVAWDAGDLVASFAKTSLNKSTEVTIDGSGIPHITIRSGVALEAGDMVYAYAPFNARNDDKEATAVTLEIPRNQVSGSAEAMPMAALPFELTDNVPSYTDQEVGTIRFLNLGSVIKLNVFSSNPAFQGETIENVTFQAGAACAGTFTYDLTSVNAESPAALSGYEETDIVVTGDGSSPVTVGTGSSDGGVFYIVVAPGTYSGTYKIRTSRADYTYVSSKSREYKRAGLKPLNIDLASANWTAFTGYDNSIDSPRELAAFLAGTSASDTDSYTITADMDMTGYTLTSASGFGGTLDGGDHTISNLASSVPLFATNAGTISNLSFDSSCVFTPEVSCVQFGALVGLDNGGTYTSVKTAASITITASADIESNIALGGLVGASNNAAGSTFNSCSNSGAITINAAEYSHWPVAMGGIAGWVRKAAFNTCKNSGPITLTALYHKPFHRWAYLTDADPSDKDDNSSVGGIVGKAWDFNSNIPNTNINYDAEAYGAYFTECENSAGGIITASHTRMDIPSNDKTEWGLLSVGGICGQGNGFAGNSKNFASINVTMVGNPPAQDYWGRQQSLVEVGGITGKSYQGFSMNSCTNRGAINVVCDQSWNGTERGMSSVGGLCGNNGYNKETAHIRFSTNHGPISVSGYGTINVGGICGANGSMRGNRVYAAATMNVQARYAYVGGLVGLVVGNQYTQYITSSYCEADITAASVLGDRYAVCTGGLIGRWATGSNTGKPSLTPNGSDSYRCHYSGNIVSTGQMKVGMVIGWVTEDNAKVFGTTEVPIQVTGTLHRWGYDSSTEMNSPLTITSSNVEDYAIGAIKAGTVTIYVDCPDAPSATLNLMSFNIREGSNWSTRKGPIVSMINGESPDIIGLQEVKDLDTWDHLTEDHPWDYLRNHLSSYSGYRYGDKTNAILYKTSAVELSNTGCFWLRDNYSSSGTSWDGYERTALYATVRDKATGKCFFYISTHFPMNDSNDGWAKCTALLEERIAALNTNDYPVILVGDFNTVNGNACWDSIKTWMYNTRYAPGVSVYSTENRDLYTYNAFGDSSKARNKVDHIWVSKSISVTSYLTLTSAIRDYGGYIVNGEKFLSDHYPIIAIINA